MALETDPGTLSPILFRGGTEYDLDWVLYDSLVELGPDLRPRPLLAKSWTVLSDGLTYTFTLKENVKWHDGQPFTAEDVAFTFYAHLNPKVNSTLRSALGALQGFEELTQQGRARRPQVAPQAAGRGDRPADRSLQPSLSQRGVPGDPDQSPGRGSGRSTTSRARTSTPRR